MKIDYQLRKVLKDANRIFIVTHHKPDGDALGSSLALYHFLKGKGYDASVISPSNFGKYLQWMPGADQIADFEKEPDNVLEKLNAADLIFCLDFNNLSRLHGLGPHVRKSKAPKVVIDHHTDPEAFYDFGEIDSARCATAELMYLFIKELGNESDLSLEIATCIYTGILTDSGSFRFPSVTPETHQISSSLIRKGVDHAAVHRNLYDNNTLHKLRFFGYCLSEKLVVLPEYRTAYIAVTHEEIERFGIQTGETEGLVNYPLSLEDIVFAALIIDRGSLVKMSFRSIGEFPVHRFASEYFSGGGHANAAGGASDLSLEETVQSFIEKVKNEKSVLIDE